MNDEHLDPSTRVDAIAEEMRLAVDRHRRRLSDELASVLVVRGPDRERFIAELVARAQTHAVYVETEVAGHATPLRSPTHVGIDFERVRAPKLLPLYACYAHEIRDDRVGLTAILAALAVGRLTAAQLARFAA